MNFAESGGYVARVLQVLHEGWFPGREAGRAIYGRLHVGNAVLMGVAPGLEAGARRNTDRILVVGFGKEGSLGCKSVQSGCLDLPVAVAAKRVPPLFVGRNQNDVRTIHVLLLPAVFTYRRCLPCKSCGGLRRPSTCPKARLPIVALQ